MTDKFRRFLLSIKLSEIERFDLDFDYIQKNPFDHSCWDMQIVKDTPWTYPLLREFLDGLSTIEYKYKIVFSYRFNVTPNLAKDLFDGWYQYNYLVPSTASLTIEKNCLVITNNDCNLDFDPIKKDFDDFLKFIGYEVVTILINDFSSNVNDDTINIQEENDISNTTEEAIQFNEKDTNNNEIKSEEIEPGKSQEQLEIELAEENYLNQLRENQRIMLEERARKRSYKKGDYKPLDSIKDVPQALQEDQNVEFEAYIFEVDVRKLRNVEKSIFTFGVGDDKSGIYVRGVENNVLTQEKLSLLKVGSKVRVRGYPEKDKRSGEIGIKLHFIDELPPDEPRKDERENKRVELHLHTKYSAFDGVSNIMEYAKAAKAMGHKAIAITDHGVAQAYPEAQKAQSKTGVKILFGSELYMVDNVLKCVMNPSSIQLDNATYVVFDFETTGLSAKYDQILEFGAWRYEKGMMVKSIDLFVKPTIAISKKITELTGITPQMVEKGVSIKEAIQIMEDFCKDAILVTHNAQFDIGFMNEARKNNGYEPINNPVIDTLALSRYLFPESRRHNLGTLARNMEITSYNEEEAHRADFDAKVLAEIWYAILSKLTYSNRYMKHEDLQKLEFSKQLLVHYRPSHVSVIAKNKKGLKDLYKLISLGHIEYFASVPKVPRSDLNNMRENLLIGSACQNGEIWDKARTKNTQELVEAMAFYDYIEVQPPECYSNLVGQEDMSEEEVIRTIKDIISAAKLAGKPVCITGDCHYCEPNEHRYRDVYVYNKGIGGTLHPLNPRSRAKHPFYENPNQHYRTTQEMFDAFAFLSEEEKEEYIVKNTNLIADSCDFIIPVPVDEKGEAILFKPSIPNCEEDLRNAVYKKAKSLYGDPLPKLIEDRLEKELVGICDNGYAVTYTIARDIILKANEDGFIVGSRGSVGSSFVATMADITEINSLPPHYRCPNCKHFELSDDPQYMSGFDLPEKNCPHCGSKMIHDGQNIPFETFLGFNADKVPDIDLNFPQDYQSKAHEYTKVLFGSDNVFRAGTIGTVADKTAFGYVKAYYREGLGIDPNTIPRGEIAYIASHCTEVKRTTGQHPGGIVVVPKEYDVYDFCPIQYPADEMDAAWRTTHFEFAAIHDTLLKLDLLGHVDPMAIKMMCEEIGIFYKDIPLNDKEVISLFSSNKALKRKSNYLGVSNGALGLPEFGTNFVRGMLNDTKPSSFAELVILSGLSHGTDVWQGNAELLVKDGKKLSEVIGCRDDIMIYLLGKGVAPKVAFKTMEDVRKGRKIKPEYEEELRKCGVPDWYIESCNKIKYMFPKAHACAYVSNALRVAYFKVHYPLVYYAIYFSIRCDKFDIETMAKGEKAIIKKIEELKDLKERTNSRDLEINESPFSDKDQEVYDTLTVALEMYERGYKIENINLYKSLGAKFVVNEENNSIIPPFNTVDGLGDIAANSVVEARKEGDFTSKEDLLKRTKLSQTHVKYLTDLGVLDDLGESDQMSLFDFGF